MEFCINPVGILLLIEKNQPVKTKLQRSDLFIYPINIAFFDLFIFYRTTMIFFYKNSVLGEILMFL